MRRAGAVAVKALQSKEPVAMVHGEALTELPDGLYIPPDALEIFLESFSGPLDLLLYLIRARNFNILDVPVAEVTHQYLSYVKLMKAVRWDLAAEYLVMAALLAEIKSRLLLPQQRLSPEQEEADPRAELVRRLQAYEQIKQAAELLDRMPQQGRDVFSLVTTMPKSVAVQQVPEIPLEALTQAFQRVLLLTKASAQYAVRREALSIKDRMSRVLGLVASGKLIDFTHLFSLEEGRAGVIVTFIALLELLRQALIEMIQTENFGTIQVRHVAVSNNLSEEAFKQVEAEVDV